MEKIINKEDTIPIETPTGIIKLKLHRVTNK